MSLEESVIQQQEQQQQEHQQDPLDDVSSHVDASREMSAHGPPLAVNRRQESP